MSRREGGCCQHRSRERRGLSTGWLLVIAAASLAALPLSCDDRAPSGAPNVLLISLDTTRKDHLSCYGYSKETTPNLDALASEGLLFANAVAASDWTLPTHASMLTGLYPRAHGARFVTRDVPHVNPRNPTGVMSPACISLAEILRGEGYRTGAIVANSWNLHPRYNVNQGFDHFDNRPGQPPTRYRRAAEITETALNWVAKQPNTPFFLLLNYMDPHIPYLPPAPFRERFQPSGPPPPGFASRRSFAERQGRTFSGQEPLSATERSFFSGWYDGEVAYMDSQIGRLLEQMQELGLYDDTLVIVTGDHGEALGEHGLAGHSLTLYEPELAVPMMVKLPGGRRRGRVDYRVHHVDVMPTVLEVLGIRPPDALNGVSMLASSNRDLIAEKYRSEQQAAFPRLYRDQFALYRGTLKYIEYSDGETELFDLASDPGEQRNLASRRSETIQALRGALAAWRTSLSPLAPGKPDSEPPSDEELEQLRELGYVQ